MNDSPPRAPITSESDFAKQNPFATPQAVADDISIRVVTPLPAKKLDPWWSMWIYPRATTRQILCHGRTKVETLLAAAFGIAVTVTLATTVTIPESKPVWIIVPLSLLAGPLLGLAYLSIGSILVSAVGRFLGGFGTRQELRTSLAWSFLPYLQTQLLWIPELALMGAEDFRSDTPKMDAWLDAQPIAVLSFFFAYVAILTLLSVWSFIVRVKAVAEAHQYSSWRAFLTLSVLFVPYSCLWLTLTFSEIAEGVFGQTAK